MTYTADRRTVVTLFLVSIFLALPILEITTSKINVQIEVLEQESEPLYSHSSSSMNEPGFQSASIFTDSSIDLSSGHACLITDDQVLRCWGSDEYGRLGDGTPRTDKDSIENASYPMGNLSTKEVWTGSLNTCAIMVNGSLYCWGAGHYGIVDGGTSDHYSPVMISLPVGRTAVTISGGLRHACAIMDDGSLYCWGQNSAGQLGLGYSNDSYPYHVFLSQPVNLGTGRSAVAVAGGESHTCAILDDSSVKCWGGNGHGQVGDGTTWARNSPVSVDLGVGNIAVAIATPGVSSCALLQGGSIKCWGYDGYGVLGNGGGNNGQTTPVSVSLPTDRTAIAIADAGGDRHHVCVILDNKSVNCWGDNRFGQVGDGTNTNRNIPTYVDIGESGIAKAVIVGGYMSCAVLDDASLKCWGDILEDTGDPINTPTSMSLPTGRHIDLSERDIDGDGILNIFDTHMPGGQAGSIFASPKMDAGKFHTCAILDNGSVSCWGNSNSQGEIGNSESSGSWTHDTVDFPSGRTATSLSTGSYHSCAVMDNGSVMCWGYGGSGQLGDGDFSDRFTPVFSRLPAGSSAVAVDAGSAHTCAILLDGSVMCWGGNEDGQLGIGNHGSSNNTPQNTILPPGRTAISIAASEDHTCAILDDYSARCWGMDISGKLGNGGSGNGGGAYVSNPSSSMALVTIPAGLNAVAIDTSNNGLHTCAIMHDGTVWCWGVNDYGSIGNGTNGSYYNADVPTMANIPSGSKAISIDVGNFNSCALLDNNSVYCWGAVAPPSWNLNLGFTPSDTPVYVDFSDDVSPSLHDGRYANFEQRFNWLHRK